MNTIILDERFVAAIQEPRVPQTTRGEGVSPAKIHQRRVEIIGVFGSGKTTLARNLASLGLLVLEEDYLANPFWTRSYQGPRENWLAMDITFLLQHVDQIDSASYCDRGVVCDYSLLSDYWFAMNRLTPEDRGVYNDLFLTMWGRVPPAHAYIYLDPGVDIILSNIRRRNRPGEAELLNHDAIQSLVAEVSTKVEALKSSGVEVLRTVTSNEHELQEQLRVLVDNKCPIVR